MTTACLMIGRPERPHGPQRLSRYEREVPKPPVEDELDH
jgi:hypothetical protein